MTADWYALMTLDTLPPNDVLKYVKDNEWQRFRKVLKGKSLEEKHKLLTWWLEQYNWSYPASVQVQNYVYALKRAGLVL